MHTENIDSKTIFAIGYEREQDNRKVIRVIKNKPTEYKRASLHQDLI